MEKNGRKIKNFIIACLLCIFPIISGVAINNNFLMNDNQIRYCTINEEFDFHLVKTQLQEKQELNSCQRYQSQEFSSIDTYSSLDYLNISEGFGIQYHVTDTYNGLDCSVWSIVQCYNRNKGNRDFVVTLIRSHDDEEYYCNSTLGGRVSYNINGRNLTFFQSGCPCGNQANFYMMFSLPRWFQDGDFWTFNDQEFNVQFIGTQIVNNIEFHDCIQINVDKTADDSECSEYLNGIGYFIAAKDVGIVKLVFNRTSGEDVCYEYISHQNMETHSIAGTILDTYGLPAQGISVQISNCDSCIRSIADESGEFEIETYGFDMILRIGYDLDDDGVIIDLYPDFPFEYPVTNITSDVTGLLIIVPSVQLINTVYVDDDYAENTPGWGYDHFDSIQDGVDAVNEGGTVYVFNGTYSEHVVIHKSLELIGEDKYSTIIDGCGVGSVVLAEDINGLTISGFGVTGSGPWEPDLNADIKLYRVSNCKIFNNRLFDSSAAGILLIGEENDDVSYNNNEITDNYCTNVYNRGIALDFCYDTLVSGNMIDNSHYAGVRIGNGGSNIICKNTVKNVDIEGGIYLCDFTDDNLIFENTLIDNIYEKGLYIHWRNDCEGNRIYHNNFIRNIAKSDSSLTNFWDDGYPSGGNYWDDYSGVDEYSGPNQDLLGNDGIGDTPYNIPGGSNQDRYPYMSQNGWNQPQNNPPIANADGPYSGTINEDIIFDGSGSYDSEGYIIGYRWDFENDGNYDTAWLSTPTTTFIYTKPGTYVIKLEVKDNGGATDTDTAIASISSVSEKPIADAGGPYYGLAGREIFVNASASYDVDGEVTGYRWDFENDGNYDTAWLSTPTTTFIYTKPGTYVIKLEVKDNGEATDTDTAIANICQPGNCPPVPILGDVYYGMVNKSISFDASRSFDLDGKIIGYRWDFNNDGHWNTIWLTSPFETHVYFSEGVYSAKLMIMDNDGLTNTTTTLVKVSVSEQINTPPSKPELPYPWNCSNDVCLNPTLSWQSSIDPDDDPISYDVYFGTSPNPSKASDGQVSTLFTPNSLMNNTKYYWYIVAKDNHDNEVKSDLWEFTTENKLSEIMMGEITGGANGVNVELWNVGETYTSNIEWSMKFEPIDGGEILQPSNHFVWGMIRRPPTNHCTNISSGQLQGYGYFDITIIADDQTKTALGFVVLGYVSIIDNEI